MSATDCDKRQSMHTQQLATIKCELCCDCVEAVPFAAVPSDTDSQSNDATNLSQYDATNDRLFVCGNYELNTQTRLKAGAVRLCAYSNSSLRIIDTLQTEAVLDLRWSSHSIILNQQTRPLLAQVSVNGLLQLLSIDFTNALNPRLQSVASTTVVGASSTALCVDWSPACTQQHSELVVSTDCGRLSHYSLTSSGHLACLNTVKTHDMEVWSCSYDAHSSGHLVWSGADDCQLQLHDFRSNTVSIKNERMHTAGVTVIHSLDEHTLITGSYDGHVRLIDKRKLTARSDSSDVLASYDCQGGIWKIKRSNVDPNVLAVASMHAGLHVLQLKPTLDGFITAESTSDENSFSFCRYREHDSMAYGCCWLPSFNQISSDPADWRLVPIVSCSFYDKSVHAWHVAT